jgi:hypothetical protein
MLFILTIALRQLEFKVTSIFYRYFYLQTYILLRPFWHSFKYVFQLST